MKALVHDDVSLKGHTAFSIHVYIGANLRLGISEFRGVSLFLKNKLYCSVLWCYRFYCITGVAFCEGLGVLCPRSFKMCSKNSST